VHNSVQLQLFLSRYYFNTTLNNSGSIFTKSLAEVYLGVLYCSLNLRQKAITQCTMTSRVKRISSRVVEGQLLPKFDDDVDNVLGLVVLYQFVKTASALTRQQSDAKRLCNIFNIKMFSHFIRFKCSLSDSSKVKHEVFINRKTHLKIHLVSDYLLYYVMCMSSHKPKQLTCNKSVAVFTDFTVHSFAEMLALFAVEQLTLFRQFISREFSSVCTIVTTDIEALYAFKSGQYERCYQLSQQNVNTLWLQKIRFNVVVSHSMNPLVDGDLSSMAALTQIGQHLRTGDDYWFLVIQVTLSVYLSVRCKLNLGHSINSLVDELRVVKSLYARLSVGSDSLFLLLFVYRFLIRGIKRRLQKQI